MFQNPTDRSLTIELASGVPTPLYLEGSHTSASPVDQLVRTIDAHAAAEAAALDSYRILRDSGDPVIAFVMQLILEDEERHHGLLRRMSATLTDALEWSHSPNALPSAAASTLPVTPAMLDTTRELIREENEGVHQLKRIARDEQHLNGGLDQTLLEMMAMDSEKHAHLLEFVLRRLQERARAK